MGRLTNTRPILTAYSDTSLRPKKKTKPTTKDQPQLGTKVGVRDKPLPGKSTAGTDARVSSSNSVSKNKDQNEDEAEKGLEREKVVGAGKRRGVQPLFTQTSSSSNIAHGAIKRRRLR